jgi:hypothetical protein
VVQALVGLWAVLARHRWVSATAATTTAWAINQQGELSYVTCAAGSEANPAAFPIARGV